MNYAYNGTQFHPNRLKLYLHQFGIPTCALNCELPVTSRCHIVEQFNAGMYDIIIASDEKSLDDPTNGQGAVSETKAKKVRSAVYHLIGRETKPQHYRVKGKRIRKQVLLEELTFSSSPTLSISISLLMLNHIFTEWVEQLEETIKARHCPLLKPVKQHSWRMSKPTFKIGFLLAKNLFSREFSLIHYFYLILSNYSSTCVI